MRSRFILLIIIELTAIFLLGGVIAIRFFGQSVVVNRIESWLVKRKPTKKLAYYYEPEKGRSYTKTLDWLEKPVAYRFNAEGFNDSKNYVKSKEDRVYRIITIGDSFTYGMNVDTGRSWPDELENMFDRNPVCAGARHEVINLGVAGYDIEYAIERLLSRGLAYEPDLVIWFPTEYERLLEKMTPLYEKNKSTYSELVEDREGKYVYEIYVNAKRQMMETMSMDEVIAYQQKAIGRLRERYSGRLLILKVPFERDEYDAAFLKGLPEKTGTEYLDIHASWDKGDRRYFLPDGHFSEKGHVRLASQVASYLKTQRKIMCSQ